MKKEISKRLTREQLAELKSLAALPDSAIDTSDAPELLDWSGAKRGVFYRPVKQPLPCGLDLVASRTNVVVIRTLSSSSTQLAIPCIACCNCSGVTSRTWVATAQLWPNGSRNWP